MDNLQPIYLYILQDEESSYILDLGFYDGPIEYKQNGNKKKAVAFFSALMRERIYRYDFESVIDLKIMIERYIKFFNEKRISTVLMTTPLKKWEELKNKA